MSCAYRRGAKGPTCRATGRALPPPLKASRHPGTTRLRFITLLLRVLVCQGQMQQHFLSSAGALSS